MSEWFTSASLFSYSAALAGGLWGITLQTDFPTLKLRQKTWRFILAVLASVFTGPYVLHTFFQNAHPSASAFWMFVISAVALAVGPILLGRVVKWAKGVKIILPKDEA